MILSGIRVCCCISGAHELANRAGRPRPGRGLPNFSVALDGEQDYDAVVGLATCEKCKSSENSATIPTQREILVSQPLRLSDSQAQPSKGTQENHGDKTSLADGDTSRAVQNYLSLALKGFVRCHSRPFRRGNGQVSPKIEDTRRSEACGSELRNSNRRHEIERKSGFVRFALMLTTCES